MISHRQAGQYVGFYFQNEPFSYFMVNIPLGAFIQCDPTPRWHVSVRSLEENEVEFITMRGLVEWTIRSNSVASDMKASRAISMTYHLFASDNLAGAGLIKRLDY